MLFFPLTDCSNLDDDGTGDDDHGINLQSNTSQHGQSSFNNHGQPAQNQPASSQGIT